jgi:hypothetical protein
MMDYRAYCTDERQELWSDCQEAIEERIQDLMREGNKFDECAFENFAENIYSATIEEADSIESYLRNKDFEKLGRLLWSISYKRAEDNATWQARDEWHNGDITNE